MSKNYQWINFSCKLALIPAMKLGLANGSDYTEYYA